MLHVLYSLRQAGALVRLFEVPHLLQPWRVHTYLNVNLHPCSTTQPHHPAMAEEAPGLTKDQDQDGHSGPLAHGAARIPTPT